MFDVDNIIRIIEKTGYSCSSVEKALGFGNGSIRRWKQSFPSINKLYALSNFLSIPICELLNESMFSTLSEVEQKFLKAFSQLNEDNQDIIVGKIKELLKEQKNDEYITEVAARGNSQLQVKLDKNAILEDLKKPMSYND